MSSPMQVDDGSPNNRLNSTEQSAETSIASDMITRFTNHRDRDFDPVIAEVQHKNMLKKCKPPISRKFGHPCNCGSNQSYLKQQQQIFQLNSQNGNATDILPSLAYGAPMYLYDSSVKKCIPTSRSRDMLLRDCHPNGLLMANFHMRSQPPLPHSGPCYYSDLVCDPRRYRCVCRQPNLHLYYSSDSKPTTFGCIPLNHSQNVASNCRQDQFFSMITKNCQKVFDPMELALSPTANTTATQVSFASIVLIWIFLLIVILVAKLRKLKRNALYSSSTASPQFERRSHNHYHYHPSSNARLSSLHRHRSRGTSAWLHPFMAAVNGHHHLSSHRSERLDNEHSQHRDTDVFLGQNRRRFNEIMGTGRNLSDSDLSINTQPPPKFDEIYPACTRASTDVTSDPPPAIDSHLRFQPPPHPPPVLPPLPPNDQLPTYEEAIKMHESNDQKITGPNFRIDESSARSDGPPTTSTQSVATSANILTYDNYNDVNVTLTDYNEDNKLRINDQIDDGTNRVSNTATTRDNTLSDVNNSNHASGTHEVVVIDGDCNGRHHSIVVDNPLINTRILRR